MNGQLETQVRTPRRDPSNACLLTDRVKSRKFGKKTTSTLKKKSQAARRATESSALKKTKTRQKTAAVELITVPQVCDPEQLFSTPSVNDDAPHFGNPPISEPDAQDVSQVEEPALNSQSAELVPDFCYSDSVTPTVPELAETRVAPEVTAEIATETAPDLGEQEATEARPRPWEPLLHALLQAWSWIQRKVTSQRTKKRLRVCESVSLGEKRFIAVIQVDGEQFLVGGSSSSVSTLARLERPQEFADVYRVCEQDLSRA